MVSRANRRGSSKKDAAFKQLNDDSALEEVWRTWTAGAVVLCRADERGIALNVESAVATYRFVCTGCGNASPWFEVVAGALRTRSSATMKTERPGAP